MPLDELSPEQIKFISKYFNTSVFRSKEKDQQANAPYEKAATAIFKEINRIRALIDHVADTYEHAPVSYYESQLETLNIAAHDAIRAAKKEIKEGKAPDFSSVDKGLKELEQRINARVLQQQSGQGVDGAAGLKEKHGETAINALQSDLGKAELVFGRALREMTQASDEDCNKRAVAIREYRKLYATSLEGLGKQIETLVQDGGVTPDACKQALDKSLNDFRTKAKPHLDELDKLLNAPPRDYAAEQKKLKTDDKYTTQDVVKRAQERTDAAKTEIKKLDEAIKKQQEKLDKLKKEFAEARNEDRAAAKTAFTNAKAQLANLQSRQQQLSGFVKDTDKRDRTLIDTTSRYENILGFALTLNTAMKDGHASSVDELSELVNALKARPIGFVEPSSADDVTQRIDAMRDEIAAAAKREVVLPKLSPTEPKMFELSDKESAALNALLDVAAKCVADGKLDMAAALIERVTADKRAFLTARQSLMLPAPLPPVPEDSKAFALRVAGFQGRLRDLIAVGAVRTNPKDRDAKKLLADLTTLGDQVRDDVKKNVPVDFVAMNKKLDEFRGKIDDLKPPQPSKELTEARKKATATGQTVDKLLDKLMRTEKITDDDIIEVPNRKYTKDELKKLVRLDEIIEVEVNGKIEQHKILQHHKGKGGQDLARREDKSIPREATDALRRKSLTLKMMSEVDTPESAEAMEAYRLEVETLAKDIETHGDTKYPKVEEIIEACKKTLKDGKVAEYIPANFATVKAGYDKFLTEWKSKGPSDALKAAEDFQTEIDKLEKAAVLLKAEYEKAKESCKSILADLKGKKNKDGDSDPLGKLMKAKLKMTPDELFAGLNFSGNDALFQQVVQAKQDFAAVKKHYAESTLHKSDTMNGAWKTKAETAMSKLRTKEAGNVTEAVKDIGDIRNEMHSFAEDMGKIDTSSGEDLAKLLIAMVAKMKASADEDVKTDKEAGGYWTAKKSVKEKTKEAKALAKTKGKNPVAKLLLDQTRGIEKQREGITSETEADGTWRLGLGSLERLERDLDDILRRLGQTEKDKGEKVKNMRIGSKPEVLAKLVQDLLNSAKDVVAKVVRPMIPTGDPEGLTASVDTLEKTLAAIVLPDLGELKKIGAQLDQANDDSEKGVRKTKAERIEGREKALAEIRKFRNALDNHPGIKLYRTNPFDSGDAVRLVQTALHQTEIAVLACVSPREKD